VSDSLRLTFKFASLFFFALSIASLVAAPVLFDTILQGKYDDGLAIMPQALLHCCVTGLASLMQNYFWCMERGRIVGFIIGIGLVLNVLLNLVCVPLWGLHGAMFATSVSGAVILVMTTVMMQRCGVHLGYSCLGLGLLPLSLLFGSIVAAAWMAIVFVMIGRTNRLFSKREKQILDEVFMPRLRKIGFQSKSLWPA
jgi:O-antigen/teichoic acid export membrane protein